MSECARCFMVVDDHPVIRMAVKILIEGVSGWRVAHEAAAPNEAIDLLRAAERPPDVLIIDLLSRCLAEARALIARVQRQSCADAQGAIR